MARLVYFLPECSASQMLTAASVADLGFQGSLGDVEAVTTRRTSADAGSLDWKPAELYEDGIPHERSNMCVKNNSITDCFVPSMKACPRRAQRKAIVTAYDGHVPLKLERLDWTKTYELHEYFTNQAQAAKDHGADYIMLVPVGVAIGSEFVTDWLRGIGMKFMEVPWAVPPELSERIPVESGGCCGAREFIKLHVVSLSQYDAVILYDTDIMIAEQGVFPEGALTPLFDCAASGYFLTTSVPKHLPWVNGGFFAVRPNRPLFDAMLRSLSTASVDEATGWNSMGWGPKNEAYRKSQYRMQGFLMFFLYQDQSNAHLVKAEQVEPCIWNRQERSYCVKVVCEKVSRVFHHTRCKPRSTTTLQHKTKFLTTATPNKAT